MSLDEHYIHETRTGDPLIAALAGKDPDQPDRQYAEFFRQRFASGKTEFVTFEDDRSPDGFLAKSIQWAFERGLLKEEEFLDECGQHGDVRSFCLTESGRKTFGKK